VLTEDGAIVVSIRNVTQQYASTIATYDASAAAVSDSPFLASVPSIRVGANYLVEVTTIYSNPNVVLFELEFSSGALPCAWLVLLFASAAVSDLWPPQSCWWWDSASWVRGSLSCCAL
jgi:hypothetical protein